jgi:hypothetical protein
MASMKRTGLAVLEEIAEEPGHRMQVWKRVEHHGIPWEQFKRVWSMLKVQGAIEPQKLNHPLQTPATAPHQITEEAREWISD